MKLFQDLSIMTSSVHSFSISMRWTSGAKKSNGDRNETRTDLLRFGVAYTVSSESSRACLCPWKYRNLQCAENV
jgi:hypothetical protein